MDTLADKLPGFDPATFDKRAFRRALGSFVTGVTIVTTVDAAGAPAGLTANSFNSVSLDPPLVLWSLALDSTNLAAFRQSSWWAVHILAAGQDALSNQFARRDGDKFAGVPTTPGPGGIPLLDGCAARFICRSAFEYEGGDHAIFLGAVEQFDHTPRTPLIYHQGSYGGVFPAPASPPALDHLGPDGRHAAETLLARAQDTLTVHELAAFTHLIGQLA
jgi:3-hydroxy-9,10-secoandrosta-1,3,5(10)-triene-9,17-dione monooxygenase reductase component